MNFLTIIYFVIGLSILIFFHELGHFIAAKVFGVFVYEFSLFMGPKLFQFKIGETKYTLRALPIGGYCSMAGEEDSQAKRNERELEEQKQKQLEEEQKSDIELKIEAQEKIDNLEKEVILGKEYVQEQQTRKEKKKKKEKVEEPLPDVPLNRTLLGIKNWKKIIIMAAGAFNNILMCFILMLVYYMAVPSSTVNVKESSQAYLVGMRDGDNITKFEMKFYEGSIIQDEEMSKTVCQGIVYQSDVESFFSIENIDKETYNFMYSRLKEVYTDFVGIPEKINLDYDITTSDGSKYSIKTLFDVRLNEDKSSLDTSNKLSLNELGLSANKGYSFGKSAKKAIVKEGQMAVAIYRALGKLFTKEGMSNVSGIVGMYSAAKTFMGYGFWYFVYFLAMISVNLGIMNLLPFPALDGGRIVITIIESITRKKVPPKVEAILNGAGFAVLILLMVAVTVKDIFFPVI